MIGLRFYLWFELGFERRLLTFVPDCIKDRSFNEYARINQFGFGPRIREEIDVNRMLVKTGDDQLPSGGHLLDPSTRAAEISRKLIIINPCDACPVNEYLDTFRSSYHCLQLRVSLPRTKPLSHRL